MASMIPPHDSLVKYHSPVVVTTARAAPKKGKKGPATPEKASTQTEDILNSILPPREWTEDGTLWVQYVSSTPATRLDVVNLQESLDRKLQQRQARETGICPVREELYAQCFDEVIRQTLYESSIAFGMRKALTAEHTKAELNNKVRTLEAEREDLEGQVKELQERCESIKDREAKRREEDDAAHAEEVDKFKKINEQLKANLEAMLSAPQRS
ncbi:unnamed protein product [Pelagomonas calceolata]|uniref:Dynein light intermediate chain n=1 Tax=Pelagomonas calceolata TaxID=35677 RepID=A0A8J2SDZ8_9STRA|nr:unnamed protein product [Pelagomonas calceolata]